MKQLEETLHEKQVVILGGSSGIGLETARREELERTLPIHRVVQPEDVAKLAVHLMLNTAITGSTHAIDGGQSLL
jgi:NAD(P)-dependent dehydrogenase (short-subunit alcohol dehydrogenase family)